MKQYDIGELTDVFTKWEQGQGPDDGTDASDNIVLGWRGTTRRPNAIEHVQG